MYIVKLKGIVSFKIIVTLLKSPIKGSMGLPQVMPNPAPKGSSSTISFHFVLIYIFQMFSSRSLYMPGPLPPLIFSNGLFLKMRQYVMNEGCGGDTPLGDEAMTPRIRSKSSVFWPE